MKIIVRFVLFLLAVSCCAQNVTAPDAMKMDNLDQPNSASVVHTCGGCPFCKASKGRFCHQQREVRAGVILTTAGAGALASWLLSRNPATKQYALPASLVTLGLNVAYSVWLLPEPSAQTHL